MGTGVKDILKAKTVKIATRQIPMVKQDLFCLRLAAWTVKMATVISTTDCNMVEESNTSAQDENLNSIRLALSMASLRTKQKATMEHIEVS
jgi:hypothetical protein